MWQAKKQKPPKPQDPYMARLQEQYKKLASKNCNPKNPRGYVQNDMYQKYLDRIENKYGNKNKRVIKSQQGVRNHNQNNNKQDQLNRKNSQENLNPYIVSPSSRKNLRDSDQNKYYYRHYKKYEEQQQRRQERIKRDYSYDSAKIKKQLQSNQKEYYRQRNKPSKAKRDYSYDGGRQYQQVEQTPKNGAKNDLYERYKRNNVHQQHGAKPPLKPSAKPPLQKRNYYNNKINQQKLDKVEVIKQYYRDKQGNKNNKKVNDLYVFKKRNDNLQKYQVRPNSERTDQSKIKRSYSQQRNYPAYQQNKIVAHTPVVQIRKNKNHNYQQANLLERYQQAKKNTPRTRARSHGRQRAQQPYQQQAYVQYGYAQNSRQKNYQQRNYHRPLW